LDHTRALFDGTPVLKANFGYRTSVYFDCANTLKQTAYGLLNACAA
jgi:hypothetical protein